MPATVAEAESAPAAPAATSADTTAPATVAEAETTPVTAEERGAEAAAAESPASYRVEAEQTAAENTASDRIKAEQTAAEGPASDRLEAKPAESPAGDPVKAAPPRAGGIEGAPVPAAPVKGPKHQPPALPSEPADPPAVKAAPPRPTKAAPAKKVARKAATAQPSTPGKPQPPAPTPGKPQPPAPTPGKPQPPAPTPGKPQPPAPTPGKPQPPASTPAEAEATATRPQSSPAAVPAETSAPTDPAETSAAETSAAAASAGSVAAAPAGTARRRETAPEPAAGEVVPGKGAAPASSVRPLAAAVRTEAWAKLIADPGHTPELLALAAVQTIGPRAQDWARRTREAYPNAAPEALARLAQEQFTRFGSVGSVFAAVAGSYAPVALLASNALTYAELILHIAAAYGIDPTDERRAADLLVLAGVHPGHADAEAALAAARQPAYEDETTLSAAVWRLGRMVAVQAGVWTAVRAVNRVFPGTALLAAVMTSRNGARTMAGKAVAYYRGVTAS